MKQNFQQGHIVGKLIKDISDRRFYFNSSYLFLHLVNVHMYTHVFFVVVLFMFIINTPCLILLTNRHFQVIFQLCKVKWRS